MPSKDKSVALSALELAHGGRRVAPAAMRRAMDAASNHSRGFAAEKLKLLRQAEQHRSKLRAPLGRKDSAAAFDGLGRIADGIAKRKVVAPPVPIPAAGILAGSYSLRLTPGYDFGSVSSFPKDARNKAFVHRRDGTMGFNVFSESKAQDAFAAISLGAFFVPLFGPVSLRANINPSFSFAFWAVSTGVNATTLALMTFGISVHKPDGSLDLNVRPTGSGTQLLWLKEQKIDLDFDFGSVADNPMHASVEVDTNRFCLLKLDCIAQAFSSARPNDAKFKANAGGILNLTLPFIDLNVQTIPVLSRD